MQDLHLIGVHDDGRHLVLGDEQGQRFRVLLDDALRTAATPRGSAKPGQTAMPIGDALSAREVQGLVRAGLDIDEVAERAGWSTEKVGKFAGPILAEREHVTSLALGQRVRDHSGSMPTLQTRVVERLTDRGVEQDSTSWSAYRGDSGPWTVLISFSAGGKDRRGSWHFDLRDRTLTALDDEARWLSEDEGAYAGPIPAHRPPPSGRRSLVYDVEAEGGLQLSRQPEAAGSADPSGAPGRPVDLMTAMRERSLVRGRRRGSSRRGGKPTPTQVPGAESAPADALPLDELAGDPGVPPPAGSRGEPSPLVDEAVDEVADGEAAGAATGDAIDPAVGDEPGGDDSWERVAFGEEDHAPHERTLELPLDDAAVRSDPDEPRDDERPEQPAFEAPPTEPATTEAPTTDDATRDGTEDLRTADPATEPASEQPARGQPARGTVEAVEAVQASESTEAAEQDRGDVPVVPPQPARSARRRGRPSVPSWDDIMFGARPGEHS